MVCLQYNLYLILGLDTMDNYDIINSFKILHISRILIYITHLWNKDHLQRLWNIFQPSTRRAEKMEGIWTWILYDNKFNTLLRKYICDSYVFFLINWYFILNISISSANKIGSLFLFVYFLPLSYLRNLFLVSNFIENPMLSITSLLSQKKWLT